MKHGIKKFKNLTQGGRANEGKIEGEKFLSEVLTILGLKTEKKKFNPIDKKIKLKMTPDFVTYNSKSKTYIILESKYKQIPGSDWEKLESNWSFHMYYYNELCKIKAEVIVILIGYWRDCQKNLYPTYFDFVKNKYGKNCIFDFSNDVSEIFRFAEFMNIKLTVKTKGQLIAAWAIHKQLPKDN